MSRDVEISQVQEEQLEEVAQFLTTQTENQNLSPPRQSPLGRRLHWLLLENPARQSHLPLGWIMKNEEGRIAGTMLCAPQRFCFQQQTYTFLMSSWYHVDRSCRGLGLFLFLRYLQLGQRYVLFVTSANAQAGALWKQFSGCPIPRTNHELVGITRWSPVIEDMIARKLGAGKLARMAARGAAPLLSLLGSWHTRRRCGELTPLASPEDVVHLNLTTAPHKVAALRDLDFIRWRYFSSPDPTVTMFSFRLRDGNRDYVVAVKETQRGRHIPIRALHVLDLSWDIPADSLPLLSALLADCYGGEIDALVFRCLSSDQVQALRQAGFWQREFQSPTGWYLDQGNLLQESDWHLTPADGDSLI